MRFLSRMALVATLALAFATASLAGPLLNPLLPVKGTREVGLSGNLQFDPVNDFNISGLYGIFLDDARMEAGVTGSYSHTEVGGTGGGDFDFYTIGGFFNYHFPGPSQLLPYVGVFIGIGGGDADDITSYGGQAGVKYFINSSVAFQAALVFRAFDEDNIDEQVGIEFGLAIYLR